MSIGYEDDALSSEFEYEGDFEFEFEQEGPYDESQELELAADLLTVTNDQELDEFLGKVFRAVKRVVKKPIARTAGKLLRNVAKKALPFVAGAAGTALGGPAGGLVGTSLGRFASNAFELELEAMSPEDQEFEVARRFVRLAGETARQAADAPPNRAPEVAAREALEAAARMWAPGLLRSQSEVGGTDSGGGGGRSGKWVRRGKNIVLIGA